MLYLGCQFTLCAKFWVSKSFLALGNQKMWFLSLRDLTPPSEIYYRKLLNWVIQKSSTLIGQQATVHIYDWLTKVKQIYESSFLLVHAINQFQTMRFLNVFGYPPGGHKRSFWLLSTPFLVPKFGECLMWCVLQLLWPTLCVVWPTQHANIIFNPLSHFHLLMKSFENVFLAFKGGNKLTTYIPWILLSMFINVHLMCWYSWVYRYIHWIFHPQRPELMKYLCKYLIERGKLNSLSKISTKNQRKH